MWISRSGKLSMAVLLLVAVIQLGCCPKCKKPQGTGGNFPAMAETEYEKSVLIVPVLQDGRLIDTLHMEAYLKMARSRPITNVGGHRQFEFEILAWEVTGESDILGGRINLALSDIPQPKSVCIATTKESDYPAAIIYNAIFDVYYNGEKVLKNQTGLGVGMDVKAIPPRVSVHFQKAFEFGDWNFMPGDCNAMGSMKRPEFEKALSRVVSFRKLH